MVNLGKCSMNTWKRCLLGCCWMAHSINVSESYWLMMLLNSFSLRGKWCLMSVKFKVPTRLPPTPPWLGGKGLPFTAVHVASTNYCKEMGQWQKSWISTRLSLIPSWWEGEEVPHYYQVGNGSPSLSGLQWPSVRGFSLIWGGDECPALHKNFSHAIPAGKRRVEAFASRLGIRGGGLQFYSWCLAQVSQLLSTSLRLTSLLLSCPSARGIGASVVCIISVLGLQLLQHPIQDTWGNSSLRHYSGSKVPRWSDLSLPPFGLRMFVLHIIPRVLAVLSGRNRLKGISSMLSEIVTMVSVFSSVSKIITNNFFKG